MFIHLPEKAKHITIGGVGSTLSFPRKSADSQTGPTTSKVEISVLEGGGETSSMCCNQIKSIMFKLQSLIC